MSVYITGDIHGNPTRIYNMWFEGTHELTESDVIVLLGDVGANYYGGKRDLMMKEYLSEIPATILCIHGNHEARPRTVKGYVEKLWNGGTVYIQEQFPNILFAKDGEVYQIGDRRCLVIGGAYSVDKFYRQSRGWAWWPDEQPDEETKRRTEAAIAGNKIDIVFSHTCPEKYVPVECFISGIDQSTVDRSTEEWLDKLEDDLSYDAWYCGHWHINKRIDKMHFLYDCIEELEVCHD